jgi:hypothetical protein
MSNPLADLSAVDRVVYDLLRRVAAHDHPRWDVVACEVVAAVRPAVLRAAAVAASACVDCGEVHEYRTVSVDDEVFRGSWAHPRDGHGYRRRTPSTVTDWLNGLAAEVEAGDTRA